MTRPDSTSVRRLPWKLWIAAEVIFLYGRVRMAMREDDIRAVVQILRGSAPRYVAVSTAAPAEQLGRIVHRLLAYSPKRSRCLVESLVLTRMLARREIDCSLVIGVASGRAFAAHAWVEADGTPLLPPLSSTYVPLIRI